MIKCTGKKCPMQVGYDVAICQCEGCSYRTPPMTNYDRIKQMGVGEMSKATTMLFYKVKDYTNAEHYIKKWLEQEVEEMTDNEIIKALECCISEDDETRERPCKGCPLLLDGSCLNSLRKYALDLINRQKAENESLKVDLAKCSIRLDNLYKTADEIKSEAIKEFAERLRTNIKTNCNPYGKPTLDYNTSITIMRYVDNLLKETVGDNK